MKSIIENLIHILIADEPEQFGGTAAGRIKTLIDDPLPDQIDPFEIDDLYL